jgi:hypothetical protein
MLLSPVLAQDNVSPIAFDPGAIWMNPDIVVNPAPNPQDTYEDHHIYPMVLNPGGMIKAVNPVDVSTQNDAWMINALAWLNNSSENSSLFYA